MLRIVLVLLTALLAGAYGDICLSRGMHQLGPLGGVSLAHLLRFGGRILLNPSVVMGFALHATFFGLWLLLLRWGDLSFIFPLTALGYVLTAIFARVFLGETVSLLRWGGTFTIMMGVAMILVDRYGVK